MSRLIKESCDGWNLRHPSDPLDPETGDWGLVYAAILSFLRHAQSNYDAELASGADRERLRAQVTTAAKQKYSWLRLSRDPRAKKEETVVEKKLYAQRSKAISQLVSEKDHLIRAKAELRKVFRPDYKEQLDAINSQLHKIDSLVAKLMDSFNINKGEVCEENGLPSEMSIPSVPEYIFGGRRLAPNYIKALDLSFPECGQKIFRTKRAIDCGCNIRLMSFACHCVNILVRPYYGLTLAGWEWVLEARKEKLEQDRQLLCQIPQGCNE
jgi:hypothetical protein